MSSLSINMFGSMVVNTQGVGTLPVPTVYSANFTVTKAVFIIDQLA